MLGDLADEDYLADSRRWIAEALPIRIDTLDYSLDVVASGWVEDARWLAPARSTSTRRFPGARRRPSYGRTPRRPTSAGADTPP